MKWLRVSDGWIKQVQPAWRRSGRGRLLVLVVGSMFAVLIGPPARADVNAVLTSEASPATNFVIGVQCVPYARRLSGIRIFGDAWTWWNRYARGTRPRIGAIMAFKPYGHMRLGHVAVVSRIIDDHTVLLRHANWSPINGVRGQIEDNVRAVDVSPSHDWRAVRVWFAPLQNLGTTHWPVQGFIYKTSSRGQGGVVARQFTHDPIGVVIERLQMAAASRGWVAAHELAITGGDQSSAPVIERTHRAGRP